MAIKKTPGKLAPIQQQVVTVIGRPAQLESSDIGTWRQAVNSAKYGRMLQLYRLYENLMIDGLFSRSVDKRIEAITNAELIFTNANGERVPEIDAILDNPAFEYMLREIMMAKAWGVSVIDVLSVVPFDCFSVPRRNLDIAKKMILPQEGAETGLDYTDIPFIIEVKSEDPMGFIYKIAPYIIYKRGGFGDWAQFAELFGMPFRIGRYSSYDPQTRDEMIKSLKLAGAAAWTVIPKEADFEIQQNSANGNGDIYLKFIDRCDKEILITVLGQTMTTLAGSSRSQSETHKFVEESINKADRRFTQRILNTSVLPILESAGLPVTGGMFNFPEQGEDISTMDRVTIALKVKADGIPVSDEYIYEISGVEKPKAGETVTKNPLPVPAVPDPNAPDPTPPDPNAPAKNKKPNQAGAFGKWFSFFAKALSKRAPLKY